MCKGYIATLLKTKQKQFKKHTNEALGTTPTHLEVIPDGFSGGSIEMFQNL